MEANFLEVERRCLWRRGTTGDGSGSAPLMELTYYHDDLDTTIDGEGEERGGLARCNTTTWVQDTVIFCLAITG